MADKIADAIKALGEPNWAERVAVAVAVVVGMAGIVAGICH